MEDYDAYKNRARLFTEIYAQQKTKINSNRDAHPKEHISNNFVIF